MMMVSADKVYSMSCAACGTLYFASVLRLVVAKPLPGSLPG